jgi:hypothetical protein
MIGPGSALFAGVRGSNGRHKAARSRLYFFEGFAALDVDFDSEEVLVTPAFVADELLAFLAMYFFSGAKNRPTDKVRRWKQGQAGHARNPQELRHDRACRAGRPNSTSAEEHRSCVIRRSGHRERIS